MVFGNRSKRGYNGPEVDMKTFVFGDRELTCMEQQLMNLYNCSIYVMMSCVFIGILLTIGLSCFGGEEEINLIKTNYTYTGKYNVTTICTGKCVGFQQELDCYAITNNGIGCRQTIARSSDTNYLEKIALKTCEKNKIVSEGYYTIDEYDGTICYSKNIYVPSNLYSYCFNIILNMFFDVLNIGYIGVICWVFCQIIFCYLYNLYKEPSTSSQTYQHVNDVEMPNYGSSFILK
jgi:hypothetical protein